MNFFLQLHRSIVEPPFYREVLGMPRSAVFRYVVTLMVFFGALVAGANTWHLINGKRGLARMLPEIFPDTAIRDGVLHPSMEQPYVPPSYLVAPLLNQLFGLPALLNHEADSFVIVDTSTGTTLAPTPPVMLLTARSVVVMPGRGATMEFPYENIMFGTKDLAFSTGQIEQFLKRHVAGIFFLYFVSTILHQGTMFFFSIFFLALAAYIFRVERWRRPGAYVKCASFALSPIAVGGALTAIAGVKTVGLWHLLVILSTVVMFRALLAIGSPEKPAQE